MERKQNKIMNAFESFRQELANLNGSRNTVDLYQAFDRLYLDYQDGNIDDKSVESRLASLKQMAASADNNGSSLSVSNANHNMRQQILARNHQDLALRMLDMPRGTWDRSHVEIVQQAISVLSKNDAENISEKLQKRLSDSIWASNYELADAVSDFDLQRDAFTSLLDSLVSHDATDGYQVDNSERQIANDAKKQVVNAAANQAQIAALRAQIANAQNNARSLEVSENYLNNLEANNIARKNALRDAGNSDASRDAIKHAVDAVKHAAHDLVNAEYAKLQAIQANIARQIANDNTHNVKDLAQKAFDKIAANAESSSAAQLADSAALLNNVAVALGNHDAAASLQTIAGNAKAAQNLEAFDIDSTSEQTDDDRALLEAHMLYEQNRMKYELSAHYADHAADMLKAMDVAAPDYAVRSRRSQAHAPNALNTKKIDRAADALKLVRALAQNAASNDVPFYAPYAGSEVNANIGNALKLADQAAPMPTAIPTIQSKRARRSNILMGDVRQVAFMPSVRSEMGFNANRYQMIDQMANSPLFKRVRFDHSNKDAMDMLPALYKAAGLRMKRSDTPLRKSSGKLDLSTSNLEIIKIIESQFDDGAKSRTDSVADLAKGASQAKTSDDSPTSRAATVVSDFIENRHKMANNNNDEKSRAKSGRLAGNELAASLRGEGSPLPKDVQEKLSPYLGFDLSGIKIFTGPVAAMAAEAMGAQAFTLGKSIFFGQKKFDFKSPEGLALLAHELTHTTHFNAGDSVNAKEQSAEAMENRVLQAFGGTAKPNLAIESAKSPAAAAKSTSEMAVAPKSVGARPKYNTEEILDRMTEALIDRMCDSLKKEKHARR